VNLVFEPRAVRNGRGLPDASGLVAPLKATDHAGGDASQLVAGPFPTLRGFGHGWQGQHNDDLVKALANGVTARYGKGVDSDATDTLVMFGLQAGTLKAQMWNNSNPASDPLVAVPAPPSTIRDRSGGLAKDGRTGGTGPLVSHDQALALKSVNDLTLHVPAEANETGAGGHAPLRWHEQSARMGAIRRLMPLECERLQSFPDGWSCLCGTTEAMLRRNGIAEASWRVSDWRTIRLDGHQARCKCPDAPRYRGAGNAVTVEPVRWILDRLGRFDAGSL